jgi:hypothetical protein
MRSSHLLVAALLITWRTRRNKILNAIVIPDRIEMIDMHVVPSNRYSAPVAIKRRIAMRIVKHDTMLIFPWACMSLGKGMIRRIGQKIPVRMLNQWLRLEQI